ncbi:MAG: DUF2058 family protein [Granulosicoccaceae bacterium]
MSDSLRDQLKQAGFAETKPKARHIKKPDKPRYTPHTKTRQTTNDAANKAKQADAAIAARKAQKIAITELIDEHQIKKFAGESVYSYTLEKKIRQLFVNDDARINLISGEWVITRLNGATYLVPNAAGTAILKINPQWLVVSSQGDNDSDDEYKEHPVPDDLQW